MFQDVTISSDAVDKHLSSLAPEGSHWGLSVRMCGEATMASRHLDHENWESPRTTWVSVWAKQLFANKQNKTNKNNCQKSLGALAPAVLGLLSYGQWAQWLHQGSQPICQHHILCSLATCSSNRGLLLLWWQLEISS